MPWYVSIVWYPENANCIGMKHTASAKKKLRSSISSQKNNAVIKYALCINNTDFPVGLELRKIYRLKSDPEAEALGFFRVFDESTEDYLYPGNLFIKISLSTDLQKILSKNN